MPQGGISRDRSSGRDDATVRDQRAPRIDILEVGPCEQGASVLAFVRAELRSAGAKGRLAGDAEGLIRPEEPSTGVCDGDARANVRDDALEEAPVPRCGPSDELAVREPARIQVGERGVLGGTIDDRVERRSTVDELRWSDRWRRIDDGAERSLVTGPAVEDVAGPGRPRSSFFCIPLLHSARVNSAVDESLVPDVVDQVLGAVRGPRVADDHPEPLVVIGEHGRERVADGGHPSGGRDGGD
jgi:hypothetical protein